MSKFLIRPHHLLCMRYFQGCGYSDEFTENMRYVISNLKNGSEVLSEAVMRDPDQIEAFMQEK